MLTQAPVAAVDEDAGRLGRFALGLLEDERGEAVVDHAVEVAADGVEGDEVLEVHVLGELEDQLRVLEEGGKDPEAIGAGFGAGRGRCEIAAQTESFERGGWCN